MESKINYLVSDNSYLNLTIIKDELSNTSEVTTIDVTLHSKDGSMETKFLFNKKGVEINKMFPDSGSLTLPVLVSKIIGELEELKFNFLVNYFYKLNYNFTEKNRLRANTVLVPSSIYGFLRKKVRQRSFTVPKQNEFYISSIILEDYTVLELPVIGEVEDQFKLLDLVSVGIVLPKVGG